jgi:hypothetical protein
MHRLNTFGAGERTIFRWAALLAAAWVLLVTKDAEAYIDPSAGGMLVQLVLAGTAGLAVLGKLFWFRIKRMFGGSDVKTGSESAKNGSATSSHDPV